MNFLGGARGSKRLISQNPLLKIVSKKYGLMLRTVENKIEIIILSLFVAKKSYGTGIEIWAGFRPNGLRNHIGSLYCGHDVSTYTLCDVFHRVVTKSLRVRQRFTLQR